jgi:hypothetical protein
MAAAIIKPLSHRVEVQPKVTFECGFFHMLANPSCPTQVKPVECEDPTVLWSMLSFRSPLLAIIIILPSGVGTPTSEINSSQLPTWEKSSKVSNIMDGGTVHNNKVNVTHVIHKSCFDLLVILYTVCNLKMHLPYT